MSRENPLWGAPRIRGELLSAERPVAVHPVALPSRFIRKRSRHLQTVAPVMCGFLATAPLLNPSSQPSTICARMATACEDFGRRGNIASFSLSSELRLRGLVRRPMDVTKYEPRRTIIQRISDSGH